MPFSIKGEQRIMMQDWFRKARLGIFIHYGIYAVGDVSESWSFHNGNISYEDYMKQCEGFTASKYDPKKWAALFKKAGADYVVMTSKHHDGVALFDTKYSDLNVLKKTPAGRDLVKEYVEAVREAGMKVGIYYSLIDWSDPRYRSVYPEGAKREDCLNDIYGSPAGGEEDPAKWEEFLKFNNNQLGELMTNYGTVDLLWFDGDWERSANQWHMKEFREYLHSLNPDVILNSRMQGYGDYETPEQGIPLYGPEGEWEFCTTINDSWGYRRLTTITRPAARSSGCSATASLWGEGCFSTWDRRRMVRWMRDRRRFSRILEPGFPITTRPYTAQEKV